jgi:hypothetical protein
VSPVTGTLQLPPMKGVEIHPGVFLLEQPHLVDGQLRALADVGGRLCVVALKLTLRPAPAS